MQKYNFSAVRFQNVNMVASLAVFGAGMLKFKAKKICFDDKICLLILINF